MYFPIKICRGIIFSQILFFITACFFAAECISADYKKIVALDQFEKPDDWGEDYNPEILIAKLFENSLISKGHYTVITKSERLVTPPFPYQYIIRGKVLKFNPGFETVLTKVELEQPVDKKKLAEVKMELLIEKSLTKKIILQKEISVSMPISKLPFGFEEEISKIDETLINKSTMGRVLNKLTAKFIGLFEKTLKVMPFEATVIAINPGTSLKRDKSKVKLNISNGSQSNKLLEKENDLTHRIMINAGSKHGIKFRDRFSVYSVNTAFIDPVTSHNLGEAWEKIGVVRIDQVEEHYATALVEAGEGFAIAQIVQPYKNKINMGLNKLSYPWWMFQTKWN
tara:strand:+ start:818 stop:1837 length:1020 start_codon:yes stop_codon:yes gene_type:complete